MTKTSPDLLGGVVEVDETYIGGISPGTRGRGTNTATIAIAVERLGFGKKSKRVKLGRVRMRAIPNTQRQTLAGFITDVRLLLSAEASTDFRCGNPREQPVHLATGDVGIPF